MKLMPTHCCLFLPAKKKDFINKSLTICKVDVDLLNCSCKNRLITHKIGSDDIPFSIGKKSIATRRRKSSQPKFAISPFSKLLETSAFFCTKISNF